MPAGGKVSVAIHAALDPRAAGGAQTSLASLVRALKPHADAIDAALIGPANVRAALRELAEPEFSVNAWAHVFPWYRGAAGDDAASVLAELESARGKPAYGEAMRRRDRELRALGAEVAHFPYQVVFDTELPSIYEPWDMQHARLPEFFSEGERVWRSDLFARACARARLVVTATASAKRDFEEAFQLPRDKIMVIRRDSRRLATPASAREQAALLDQMGVTAPYALFPAQTFAHKNHARLFEALALLRDRDGLSVPLVCSGRKYDAHWAPIGAALSAHALEPQVKFVGGVSDAELSALFSGARMLAFPSRFEGLGLPILEAMQFDLPMAVSNASCLPEVVGEAGVLFDPDDVAAMADAIKRVWSDEDLRQRLAQAGRVQRARVSWDEAARAYVAAYRYVAGRPLDADDRARLEAGLAA